MVHLYDMKIKVSLGIIHNYNLLFEATGIPWALTEWFIQYVSSDTFSKQGLLKKINGERNC